MPALIRYTAAGGDLEADGKHRQRHIGGKGYVIWYIMYNGLQSGHTQTQYPTVPYLESTSKL